MKHNVVPSFVLLALALLTAGCASLNKAGVYQGNKTLYAADLAIASSYQMIDGFLKFEQQARGSVSEDVTKAADRIRAQAPMWFNSALALRDTYKGDPTQTNADNLQKALDVLRTAVAEATRYLIQHQGPANL